MPRAGEILHYRITASMLGCGCVVLVIFKNNVYLRELFDLCDNHRLMEKD